MIVGSGTMLQRLLARCVAPGRDPVDAGRESGRRVRPVDRHGRGSTGLSSVRCPDDLVAGEGRPGIAVSGPRLIAIAGERAARNGRPSDSWELVMPCGELVSGQRRPVAAGEVVRVHAESRP